MAEADPTRPLLRYLGGKWRIAPWIIDYLPAHRCYVEPYGGAVSVLMRKPRSRWEVVNDLDGEIVNLLRVLRDADQAARLVRLISLTPYARLEYDDAFSMADDPVERARRMLVRSHMGHGTGSARIDRKTGFRTDGQKLTTRVSTEWAEFPPALAAAAGRLAGVTVENVPALDLIDRFDVPETLIYLDPPYMPETRSRKAKRSEEYHSYAVEMTEADHQQLLDRILRARAMVVISGYATELYLERLAGWRHLSCRTRSHGNHPRVEHLWLNDAAAGAGRLL